MELICPFINSITCRAGVIPAKDHSVESLGRTIASLRQLVN